MTTPDLIGLFVAPLNRAGIEYMVTGGLAAIVYGHPRMTLDVDLVLRLSDRDASAFVSLWSPTEFYVPPIEAIDVERTRTAHGHCNVIHNETMMRADVYFAGSDEFASWALSRCAVRSVRGELVRFAPVEYVIVNKLRYFQMGGSDRHLRDVFRIIEVSGSEADRIALQHWIARYSVENEWIQAQTYADT